MSTEMAGVHQQGRCLVKTPALPHVPCGEPCMPPPHCMEAPEHRDLGVPHSCRSVAPTFAGSTEPERGLRCYLETVFTVWGEDVENLLPVFMFPGGERSTLLTFFPVFMPLNGRNGQMRERTSLREGLSPVVPRECHTGGGGLLLSGAWGLLLPHM